MPTVKPRSWVDYISDARDELLRSGVEVDPEMVVEYARTMPGGADAENAVASELGRRQSRRIASAALRESETLPVDPDQIPLFEGIDYTPPRSITKRAEGGRVVHKGIMHATPKDGSAYDAILTGNIDAAVGRRQEWRTFAETIRPWWHGDRTVGDALAIRADEH